MCIRTYNGIPECQLYGESHVCMAVEGVEVVFIVANSCIQLGEPAELYFYDGVEAVE